MLFEYEQDARRRELPLYFARLRQAYAPPGVERSDPLSHVEKAWGA